MGLLIQSVHGCPDTLGGTVFIVVNVYRRTLTE